MSLLLFVCLVQVASVMAQSTVLDSQCDNDCYMMKVQIQMLTEMMGNVKDANDKLTQTVMELRNKNDMLENKVNKLDQDLANQKFITSFDCEDIRSLGYDVSGVYGVNGGNGEIKHVYCEMSTDSGTWTRILHRQDNLTEFVFKTWAEYEAGFGDPKGSHWMGLIQMNKLTTNKAYKLRVDLMDWENNTRYAQYSTFRVGPASDKYRLSISGYSGTAGDSMTRHNLNNTMFSTIDQDNDQSSTRHCADGTGWHTGGWWYNNCFYARLTGPYLEGGTVPKWHGIQWYDWRGGAYSYKVATMKVQRL